LRGARDGRRSARPFAQREPVRRAANARSSCWQNDATWLAMKGGDGKVELGGAGTGPASAQSILRSRPIAFQGAYLSCFLETTYKESAPVVDSGNRANGAPLESPLNRKKWELLPSS